MSKELGEPEFEEALKMEKKLLVLFYASWCPFSRKFLPIFEKCTIHSPTPCLRLMVDNYEELCEKYSINVFPTVLFFENGRVAERLDGAPGEGLSEKQLKQMLGSI